MRQLYVSLLALLICTAMNAQSALENKTIKELQTSISMLRQQQREAEGQVQRLRQEHSQLQLQSEAQQRSIDSLQNACRRLETTLTSHREEVNDRLGLTDENLRTNQNVLQERTLWGGGIAVAIVAILLGIAYWLTKRIKRGTSSINEMKRAQDALKMAQTKMHEESVSLDNKLLELAERQLNATPAVSKQGETDHSLALKVADELVRIQVNMSHMDASVKGYKQLAKAVQRIKDNFSANGYEIVDMLGKPYNEGMKATANFIVDETLEEGQRIITGIIKPQINYNGTMIQSAQITVSQNN